MMKLLIIAVGTSVMIEVLAGCSRQPPPSTQTLPLYAGAQDVQVQTVKGIKGIPAQQTTFTTTDSPENVKDFYRQVLLSDGWEVTNSLAPKGLHFYWIEGCPVYGLDLVFETNDKGQTVVKLKLQREDCM